MMRELQGGGIICQDVTETCQDSNKACQDVIKICQEGSRTYKTAVLCHDAKPVKTVARHECCRNTEARPTRQQVDRSRQTIPRWKLYC